MTQTLVPEPATTTTETGHAPWIITLNPVMEMTDDQFAEFCALNDDMRIELTAEGIIEIMPPTFAYTGNRNIKISAALQNWTSQDGSGLAFDSSTGFTLPNGAIRSPDASWIPLPRWSALTRKEQESFSPICPDFVIELRSGSDRLSVLQAKMEEYMANGARLGWLLDPIERRAHIYRPNAQPEILDNPDTLSADPELPAFTLDLTPIWEPAI